MDCPLGTFRSMFHTYPQSPRWLGAKPRSRGASAFCRCHQPAGFVIVAPTASFKVGRNWLARRTPERICLAKLGLQRISMWLGWGWGLRSPITLPSSCRLARLRPSLTGTGVSGTRGVRAEQSWRPPRYRLPADRPQKSLKLARSWAAHQRHRPVVPWSPLEAR
jgi:hypothetical protein